MLYVVITLFVALATTFATFTILRPPQSSPMIGRRSQLYQSQLAEIDREETNGIISSDEAMALRTEAQRRLLDAAENPENKDTTQALTKTPTAMLLAGLIVVGGGVIYASLGRPDVSSVTRAPTDLRALQTAPKQKNATTAIPNNLISQLEARLQSEPNDAEGWWMLGRSYYSQSRYSKAAEAFKKAVDLVPENTNFLSAYGEALLGVNEGKVNPEIEQIFSSVLTINPNEPRARFFKGLALDQAGDTDAAVTAWVDLINSAPPGAPWAEDVLARVTNRAKSAGIDISGRIQPRPMTSSPPNPSRADINAAMEMSPEDRKTMIEGMVESLEARLESNPDDPEGWARLIRSQMVLGQKEKAKMSLKIAAENFENRPKVRARIIADAKSLGVELK